MAIGSDYPSPVFVNGFSCRNCGDVSLAQKHIDPAHPKSGAFGADAASDPTASAAARRDAAMAQARSTAAAPPKYDAAGQPLLAEAAGQLVDLAA